MPSSELAPVTIAALPLISNIPSCFRKCTPVCASLSHRIQGRTARRRRLAPSPIGRESGKHLCWKSSMFWRLRLPHSILGDQGVGEDEEFSGDCDDGDLWGLSADCQTLIEG